MFVDRNVDSRIQFQKEDIYLAKHQLYAQNVFNLISDIERFVIFRIGTGGGKTITSLSILARYQGRRIIVGNKSTIESFTKNIEDLKLNLQDFQFYSIQKLAQLSIVDLITIFTNAYIVIDEFQGLYSQQGLNSYGETIKQLYKHVKSVSKFICLSATPINTIPTEIKFILDIFGYDVEKTTIDQDIRELGKHVVTYTKESDAMPKKTYIQEGPQISEMKLIRCPMTEEQYKANSEVSNIERGQLKEQRFIQPKYYYDGKRHPSGQPLPTSCLTEAQIKAHAPLQYRLLQLLWSILENKECKKSAIYVDNVDAQFGLIQYVEMFKQNGWIPYGSRPNQATRCSVCGRPMSKHSITQLAHYKPTTFAEYKQNQTDKERAKLIGVYNSFDNRFGYDIQLLFITAVGQTGLNLRAVCSFFIVDNIPNMSLFNQIVARSVRTNGHTDLPKSMWNVDIYVLVPSAPHYKPLTQYEEQWIQVYEDGQEVQKLYEKLDKQSYLIDPQIMKLKRGEVFIPRLSSQKDMTPTLLNHIYDAVDKFISGLPIQQIKLTELYQLMNNSKLNPIHFDFDSPQQRRNIDVIVSRYFTIDKAHGVLNRKQRLEQYKPIHPSVYYQDYTNSFYRSFQDTVYPDIKLTQFQKASLDIHSSKSDIYDQLESNDNVYGIKSYIKLYMLNGIDFSKEFLRNRKFTAYMVWDNQVYIQGDETNYVKNHYELMKEIVKYTLDQTIETVASLVKRFKIVGYYQGEDVIIPTQKNRHLKLLQRPIDPQRYRATLGISNTLASFKWVTSLGIQRDCIVQQPLFDEIFKDEKFIKEVNYENTVQVLKCRFVLLYTLYADLFLPPQFVGVKL